MKRTQLSIKTTSLGNCKIHIFRAEDQYSLPADLTELKKLTPVMIVPESLLEKEAESMNEVIDPDLRKVPKNDLIPYSLSFEPLRNGIHYFELHTEYVNAASGDVPVVNHRVLHVDFVDDGVISRVKYTTEEGMQDLTGKEVIKFAGNTVFIKDDIVNGTREVAASYFMKVINVVDDAINQIDGVTYNGPVATGLTVPALELQNIAKNLTSGTFIPTLKLQANRLAEGTVYYYRLVAEDSLGNLSDPSGLISSYLSQEEEEVRFAIDVSDDGITWANVGQFKSLEEVEFGIPGTVMYTALGSLLCDTVKAFTPLQLVTDNSAVISDNKMSIMIPNPFNQGDITYRERNTKKFRSRAVDSYGKTSNWTEAKTIGKVQIPIEKIVVLRKNVKSLLEEDRDNPIALNDPLASEVKTWIRRYGVYYDSLSHQMLPMNVRVSDAKVVIFDDETTFPTITMADTGIVTGEMYNYTFYLVDAFGQYSLPTAVVVTT